MSEQTPEQKELQALSDKNAELLNELKRARNKARELEADKEALTAERDAATSEYRRLALERPRDAMLERVAILPDHFMIEFNARGYDFVLEGDEIVIRDKEGNPAMIGEEARTPTGIEVAMREATFTEEDIKKLVAEEWLPKEQRSPHAAKFDHLVYGSRASGGGAIGGRGGHAGSSAPTPKQTPRIATGLK